MLTAKPSLGILTVQDKRRQFRGNRENFIDLIKMGETIGVNVYVITAQELILTEPIIFGYQYEQKTDRWIKKRIPIPRVLYNRIPFREDELDEAVAQKVKECLRHPHIQLFNPSFFNKWTLFEWLKHSKLTRPYIPATRKLTPKMDLARFLNRHSVAYLKPVRGKAGKGIMRLRRVKGKKYRYHLTIQHRRKSYHHHYKKIASVRTKLNDYIEQEPYIVQQGIRLSSFNRRPYDLRVLVQKNKQGNWVLTGIGARIAGEKSITTHVPRGGRIDDPKNVLTHSFGNNTSNKLLVRTKKAALAIARQIERRSGYRLGEMSMDLGIDARGKIWFFEANSKPMKFDEPHIRQKSLQRILDYSMYLSGQKQSGQKQGGQKQKQARVRKK